MGFASGGRAARRLAYGKSQWLLGSSTSGIRPTSRLRCVDSGGDPRDCCRRSARASWALASLVTMAETKAPATPVWERRVFVRSSRVMVAIRAQSGPVLWLKDGWAATESTRAKACHGEAGYDVKAEATKGRRKDPGEGSALLGASDSGWENARARDVIEHGHMHASSDCWR